MDIKKLVLEKEEFMIDFRRDLHMHPELSNEEFRTSEKIVQQLEKMNIPYKKVGNTSIVATIKGNKLGKTIALRADMDALPVIEETDVEFKSKEVGKFHACGHDTHISMLLAAASILNNMKDEINGTVKLIFQEAEENFTGAKLVIRDGGLDGVDAIFGMHNFPLINIGFIDISSGVKFAGVDTITVTFEGESGHGSAPHRAKDTIHPACLFVTDVQTIVTKNIDPQIPIVLNVGTIQGGTKPNIVSKSTKIEISMRYLDPKARDTVHKSIIRHANNIAEMYEIKAKVDIVDGALALVNDDNMAELAKKVADKVLGENKLELTGINMGSEDFSYYSNKIPGVFVWMGSGNPEKNANYFPHNEKYKVDEDFMKYGVEMYIRYAIDYLNQ